MTYVALGASDTFGIGANDPYNENWAADLEEKANQAEPDALPCWLADDEYIYPLKVGLNTMGRSSDNDVIVPDCYISRRHCAILVHSGTGCELHDTASKNGTFLEGSSDRITLRPLANGDVIHTGGLIFAFVLPE